MARRSLLSLLATSAFAAAMAQAQTPVPSPIPSDSNQGNAQENTRVLTQPAKPVIIKGKRASELSEQELLDFLQSKIKVISQEDGEVVMLKVAPGYVLTLTYDELPLDAFAGDPQLASFTKVGKTIVITAKERAGDTNFKVLFSGGIIREYQIFIAPNFATADNSLRIVRAIAPPLTSQKESAISWTSASGDLNIAALTKVVNNYDALVQERALDPRRVRRQEVFRRGSTGSFLYYYTFSFPNKSAAVSFSYRNRTERIIQPSRIRLQIGDIRFVPDLVVPEKRVLQPGETSYGYVFFKNPAFTLDQEFELVIN
jgi:hypothetical protein